MWKLPLILFFHFLHRQLVFLAPSDQPKENKAMKIVVKLDVEFDEESLNTKMLRQNL